MPKQYVCTSETQCHYHSFMVFILTTIVHHPAAITQPLRILATNRAPPRSEHHTGSLHNNSHWGTTIIHLYIHQHLYTVSTTIIEHPKSDKIWHFIIRLWTITDRCIPVAMICDNFY
ncbi:hypothetical protein CDL12_19531 [Handroanthus impetiginosus]|uniref:Uncharacterized protein n=1 Tax=Handroanthus impetiginosus TaxID=429701 RepID=A0A2G9GRL7_9LAMI|nr:hypothetical protein CDL12_19531 [Handroanthus impetiginosus]